MKKLFFKEIDMMTEAANAQLLANNFKNCKQLYIPKVYWNLCKTKVLVTEKITATPIYDIKNLKNKNTDFEKIS